MAACCTPYGRQNRSVPRYRIPTAGPSATTALGTYRGSGLQSDRSSGRVQRSQGPAGVFSRETPEPGGKPPPERGGRRRAESSPPPPAPPPRPPAPLRAPPRCSALLRRSFPPRSAETPKLGVGGFICFPLPRLFLF